MRLHDATTGTEIRKGDRVRTFRGEDATLIGMREPQHDRSTGRITVLMDGFEVPCEFYPSVIGAEFLAEPEVEALIRATSFPL